MTEEAAVASHLADGLAQACDLLETQPPESRSSATQILGRLVQNLIDAPENPKYRRVRVSNVKIKALLGVPGSEVFLRALGFEDSVDSSEGSDVAFLEIPEVAALEIRDGIGVAALERLRATEKILTVAPGGDEPPPQHFLSWPELQMRATIELLLALPASEREAMAAAEVVTFGHPPPGPKHRKPTTAPPFPAALPVTSGKDRKLPSPPPLPTAGQKQAATKRTWNHNAAQQPGITELAPESLAPRWRGSVAACVEKPCLATLDCSTTECAALLCERGYRPAVLNFAHGYNCGGGFEHQAGSQEEDLFRGTSLFMSLWPHRRLDDGAGVLMRGRWIGDYDERLPRREPFYPHTSAGGIYSPHVRLLLDLSPSSTSAVEAAAPTRCITQSTVGVVSVAAQDVGRDPPFDPALLSEKLRTALYLAASHGHDALVLGAFGCGYFRNPVTEVVAMFSELLTGDGEFASTPSCPCPWSFVAFAVPRGYGGGNYRAFAEAFPQMEIQAVPPRGHEQ